MRVIIFIALCLAAASASRFLSTKVADTSSTVTLAPQLGTPMGLYINGMLNPTTFNATVSNNGTNNWTVDFKFAGLVLNNSNTNLSFMVPYSYPNAVNSMTWLNVTAMNMNGTMNFSGDVLTMGTYMETYVNSTKDNYTLTGLHTNFMVNNISAVNNTQQFNFETFTFNVIPWGEVQFQYSDFMVWSNTTSVTNFTSTNTVNSNTWNQNNGLLTLDLTNSSSMLWLTNQTNSSRNLNVTFQAQQQVPTFLVMNVSDSTNLTFSLNLNDTDLASYTWAADNTTTVSYNNVGAPVIQANLTWSRTTGNVTVNGTQVLCSNYTLTGANFQINGSQNNIPNPSQYKNTTVSAFVSYVANSNMYNQTYQLMPVNKSTNMFTYTLSQADQNSLNLLQGVNSTTLNYNVTLNVMYQYTNNFTQNTSYTFPSTKNWNFFNYTQMNQTFSLTTGPSQLVVLNDVNGTYTGGFNVTGTFNYSVEVISQPPTLPGWTFGFQNYQVTVGNITNSSYGTLSSAWGSADGNNFTEALTAYSQTMDGKVMNQFNQTLPVSSMQTLVNVTMGKNTSFVLNFTQDSLSFQFGTFDTFDPITFSADLWTTVNGTNSTTQKSVQVTGSDNTSTFTVSARCSQYTNVANKTQNCTQALLLTVNYQNVQFLTSYVPRATLQSIVAQFNQFTINGQTQNNKNITASALNNSFLNGFSLDLSQLGTYHIVQASQQVSDNLNITINSSLIYQLTYKNASNVTNTYWYTSQFLQINKNYSLDSYTSGFNRIQNSSTYSVVTPSKNFDVVSFNGTSGPFMGALTYTTNFTILNEPYQTSSSGLSGGAIAGIVIGCVAFVCIVGIVIYCLMKKKPNNDYHSQPG